MNSHLSISFRIAQDGLESIFKYVGPERKINIPKEDLITLLLNDTPEKSPPITSLSQSVQEQVKDLCMWFLLFSPLHLMFSIVLMHCVI